MLIRTLIIIRVLQALTSPVIDHFDPTTTPVEAAVTETTETTEPALDPYGIHGADNHAEAIIAQALDRFAEAALPLPELRIYVHDSQEGCDGHQGLYSNGGDPHRIDLCDLDATIHELAHAWEHHHLTDQTRTAFMDHYDIEGWNDPDLAHAHRGVEQVAFAITWGLADQPVQAMLADHYADQLERYELLTGTTSPRLDTTHTHTTLDIDIDTTTTDPNFA